MHLGFLPNWQPLQTLHDIFKQKAVSSANKISLSVSASDLQLAENPTQNKGSISDVGEAGQCRLTITIFCPHGVKKTYKLTYSAGACMVALASKEACLSMCKASPRTLKEWTDHFALGKHGTDEVTLWCTRNSCKLRSFEGAVDTEGQDGHSSRGKENALSKQALSTTLTIATDEFEKYQLGNEEALITISLKEFKAIIDFAVGVGNSIDIHFKAGGE